MWYNEVVSSGGFMDLITCILMASPLIIFLLPFFFKLKDRSLWGAISHLPQSHNPNKLIRA
jgi:hypothetical protein